jgi:hypothetical protein
MRGCFGSCFNIHIYSSLLPLLGTLRQPLRGSPMSGCLFLPPHLHLLISPSRISSHFTNIYVLSSLLQTFWC